jgi:hypothetical protein
VKGFWACRRLELTALKSNQYSGWATITHPFHPLRGQRFKVLSTKTFKHRDILSLEGTKQGTIGIPRDWTDKSDPNLFRSLIEPPPILSFSHLLQLVELIAFLNEADSKISS